jgi:hypothetical protein
VVARAAVVVAIVAAFAALSAAGWWAVAGRVRSGGRAPRTAFDAGVPVAEVASPFD